MSPAPRFFSFEVLELPPIFLWRTGLIFRCFLSSLRLEVNPENTVLHTSPEFCDERVAVEVEPIFSCPVFVMVNGTGGTPRVFMLEWFRPGSRDGFNGLRFDVLCSRFPGPLSQ